MTYRLPTGKEDDPRILLNARYAEPFADTLRITQRLIEITAGNRTSFGVMCIKHERLFGRMPLPGSLDGPSIDQPKTIDELGADLDLAEQKAVISEFRKIQNGRVRDAMAAVSEQLEGKPVYFQYYGQGVIAVLQTAGAWTPCLLRFQNANTLAEERICAKVNRASKQTYSVLKNALAEMIRNHAEEEERLRRIETERLRVEEESDDSADESPDGSSGSQNSGTNADQGSDAGRWADVPPPDPDYDIEWDDVDNVTF